SHLYSGKKDWSVHFGFYDAERSSVAIQFTVPGVYTFDDLNICTVDFLTKKSNVASICKGAA
ncbi:MAG: hypothetical protein HUJ51_05035, partial [Eggerthellaceae bacterium]|nr:hypothetical protein [Eggerthellaceae bacterium]